MSAEGGGLYTPRTSRPTGLSMRQHEAYPPPAGRQTVACSSPDVDRHGTHGSPATVNDTDKKRFPVAHRGIPGPAAVAAFSKRCCSARSRGASKLLFGAYCLHCIGLGILKRYRCGVAGSTGVIERTIHLFRLFDQRMFALLLYGFGNNARTWGGRPVPMDVQHNLTVGSSLCFLKAFVPLTLGVYQLCTGCACEVALTGCGAWIAKTEDE
ncbi:hypothetical protein EDC01DRAFT_46887 [Geopyxis carbonaria]|nr:hypothetical protein EDC01DRAFT_46887 [Geopyxis carbonaria]